MTLSWLSLGLLIAAFALPLLMLIVATAAGRRVEDQYPVLYFALALLVLSALSAALAFVPPDPQPMLATVVLVIDILLLATFAVLYGRRNARIRKYAEQLGREPMFEDEPVAWEEPSSEEPREFDCILRDLSVNLPDPYDSRPQDTGLGSFNRYVYRLSIRYTNGPKAVGVEAVSKGTFEPWTTIFLIGSVVTRRARAIAVGEKKCTKFIEGGCLAVPVRGMDEDGKTEFSAGVLIKARRDDVARNIGYLDAEAAVAIAAQIAVEQIGLSGSGSGVGVELALNVPKSAQDKHKDGGTVSFECVAVEST